MATEKKSKMSTGGDIEETGGMCDILESIADLEQDDSEFLVTAVPIIKAMQKDELLAEELEKTYHKLYHNNFVVKQQDIATLVQSILQQKVKSLTHNSTLINTMNQKALVLGKDFEQYKKAYS